MRTLCLCLCLYLLLTPCLLCAQKTADSEFTPSNNRPAYAQQSGPLVYIDGGHGNFHTADFRFEPFAKLLERDGYRIASGSSSFTRHLLGEINILVISNALHQRNLQDWTLPTPSAFTQTEVQLVHQWVKQGGRLLLIADHMPFPGASAALAAAFGFTFSNGFAMVEPQQWPPALFSLNNGTLKDHIIVNDQSHGDPVQSVATFTGQGFQIPENAENLLEFDERFYSLMPDTAWQFHAHTPKVNLNGWSQGAVMRVGNGRVAVFGEAAMFTAQVVGPPKTKVGFNAPEAPHNAQFVLNVMHWLDGKILTPKQ